MLRREFHCQLIIFLCSRSTCSAVSPVSTPHTLYCCPLSRIGSVENTPSFGGHVSYLRAHSFSCAEHFFNSPTMLGMCRGPDNLTTLFLPRVSRILQLPLLPPLSLSPSLILPHPPTCQHSLPHSYPSSRRVYYRRNLLYRFISNPPCVACDLLRST